jgi:hypothetical protein
MEDHIGSMERTAPSLDELNSLYDAAGFGPGIRKQAERIATQF